MHKIGRAIIKSYFEDKSIVDATINSFNQFVKKEIPKIIDENKVIEPTILPPHIEEYKIIFESSELTTPEVIEADGSVQSIYPMDARIRKLTYSAPLYLTISTLVNGNKGQSEKKEILDLPIMLKSDYCNLRNLSREDLIKVGEDPDDPGGYFIINGSEKVVVNVEDLASNRFTVEETSKGYVGKIFSETGSFKIPHQIEMTKDGLFKISFAKLNQIPIMLLLKALGFTNDKEIIETISNKQFTEVILNLYYYSNIHNEDEAFDQIAKLMNISQIKEVRIQRMKNLIDMLLLPHLGTTPNSRIVKAYNLCKYLEKYILIMNDIIDLDDKDHYMNKRLKLAGDSLTDLFRVNFKILIKDMLFNFQRLVRRGKTPSKIGIIVKEKVITSRFLSALATGNWIGDRKGISQRIQRHNFIDFMSQLQRVISPLTSSQENLEARELHPTTLGRLCPIETPEGSNIGLKKNLALLSTISLDYEEKEKEIIKSLKSLGLQPAYDLELLDKFSKQVDLEPQPVEELNSNL